MVPLATSLLSKGVTGAISGKATFSWRLRHEGIDMAALPGQQGLASIAISALLDEPCQLAKLTLLGQECQTSMATPALPDQPNLALLS